jgi:tetratricopeptide (TPR) repeat protein/predicted aspartyl protease
VKARLPLAYAFARAFALATLTWVAGSRATFGKCEIKIGAQFQVTMRDMRPLVAAKFNGADATLLVDSGAFYSMITAGSAAEFGLKLSPAPFGLRVTGVDGSAAQVSVTTVEDLTLAGQSLHRIQFLVGGSEAESGSAGLIGQNILGYGDVEYDLGNGVIRLIRTTDCRKALLAYWAKPDESVGVVDIESLRDARNHTIGTAYVNGTKIRVMFDTGAGVSMLTLAAAARAGIKRDDPGVVPAGLSHGVGKTVFRTWIAPVKSFSLGGEEEIKNTQLRIGDTPSTGDEDMLIGPDFFLSHRIYVSNDQHKLYFTYNGGPVFNLKQGVQAAETPPAAPDDAAALSRLGMALAARHDYEHALEDLEKACALAPNEPEYLYERAYIHMQRREGEAASADLDATLRLKPDHLLALLARAQMRLGRKDPEDAAALQADLDTIDRSAPKPSEYRFELATLYARAHLLPQAIAQYDLWIAAHGEDAKISVAHNARCEEKVLLDQDLDNALLDCNAAVRSNPKSAAFLGNRGLARLRRGEYKKAIDDFDDALKIQAKLPWIVYARGIAKIRLGKSAEGQADIDAAKVERPAIAEDTAAYGFVP